MHIGRTSIITASLCAIIVASAWHSVSARSTDTNENGVSESGLESGRDALKKQQEQLREAQKKAAEEKAEAEKSRQEAEKQKTEEERETLRNEKTIEAKKKVCQNHETSIKQIVARTVTNGQRHFDMITKVYTNVKSFAGKRNIELASYSSELANVDSAAAAAQAAINTAKSVGDDFNCDSTAPKSAASAFLAAKKAQAAALKSYRDAVKQLLAAIKSSIESSSNTSQQPTGGDQ